MSGTVLLIAGPSGSGKTTLTRALVKRVPFLTRAITVTTRLPRPGEVSGEDYHFFSPGQFVEMNRSGALIECAETYTESYGIPRTVLVGLCDRALILTGGSALALRQRLSNSISIFIQPASAAAAAARIIERNCPNSQSRIAGYEQEVAASSQFDRVFLNKDFAQTLEQIEDFYLSARRQTPHGRPARKFDTGAGKGTGDGPVLCVPRLETGAKSYSSCHNCLQGRFGLMADVYPSVRHPSGTCIACFRPAPVSHPSHSPWKSQVQRFPHSHRTATAGYKMTFLKGQDPVISVERQQRIRFRGERASALAIIE